MRKNMKPDRIQIRPPIDVGDLPWSEKAPNMTRSLDFDETRDAALFMIYADEVANESEEIRVSQELIRGKLTITVEPVNADFLTHAVYEYAALIDATLGTLRRSHFDQDELED